MSKLHAKITNENGATVSKGGNEYLKIELSVGNRLWETLTIKYKKDIVEPMNYHQSIDGYVLETEYGTQLSYILSEAQGKTPQSECKHFIVKDDNNKEYCQECGIYRNF